MYCHIVYVSTWPLLHFGETCSFASANNVIAFPNQKSNKNVKTLKKWQTNAHCIFIFIWQFSSFFEEKKSGSFFYKNSYSGSYSKTKKKKKRERERERERDREKDKRRGEEEEVNARAR